MELWQWPQDCIRPRGTAGRSSNAGRKVDADACINQAEQLVPQGIQRDVRKGEGSRHTAVFARPHTPRRLPALSPCVLYAQHFARGTTRNNVDAGITKHSHTSIIYICYINKCINFGLLRLFYLPYHHIPSHSIHIARAHAVVRPQHNDINICTRHSLEHRKWQLTDIHVSYTSKQLSHVCKHPRINNIVSKLYLRAKSCAARKRICNADSCISTSSIHVYYMRWDIGQ